MMPEPPGNRNAEESFQLTARQLLLYALLSFPLSLIILPMGIVLPSFYAENTATTLAAIGTAAFFTRAFDAIADPIIGHLSDHTQTSLGARKPWLVAGAIICTVAIYFLFIPPRTATIVYYSLWSLVFNVGYSFFDVPSKAWGSELSRRYQERSRIATFVTAATVAGSAVFWLIMIAQPAATGSSALNPMVFRITAVSITVILPLLMILAALFVPIGVPAVQRQSSLLDILRALRGNRLLWRFTSIVALWQIGNGVFQAVFFIYFTQYLRLGREFGIIMLAYFCVQIVSMPLWLKVLYHYGKNRPWAVSWAVNALLALAVLFIKPGPAAFWPAIVLSIVIAAVAAGGNIVPPAVLGDIIDYDIFKTRVNRAGNYFAIQNTCSKLFQGAGLGLGLIFISAFGYKYGTPIEGRVKIGLLIAYAGLPALFQIAAALLTWNFPLDRRRHDIIRNRIEQRRRRAEKTPSPIE